MVKKLKLGVGGLLLGAAVAAAQPLPPGYVWCLANCGPAVNSTRLACNNCCRRAGSSGTIPAVNIVGCQAACTASTFPVGPSWWDRIIIRLFS